MGSRRPKKKTLKQRQANQLKNPFTLLEILILKTKKYLAELDIEDPPRFSLVGNTMKMKRFKKEES